MIEVLVFSVLSGVFVCLLHVWRCGRIEDRFNRRFDEAAGFWHSANRKLSAENESLRAGYMAMFPEIERIQKIVASATSSDTTKEPEQC